MLQFIMELARRMHLSVVAEGVETEEQKQMVIDLGVEQIQGYYYSKPLPGDEMEGFLKAAVK